MWCDEGLFYTHTHIHTRRGYHVGVSPGASPLSRSPARLSLSRFIPVFFLFVCLLFFSDLPPPFPPLLSFSTIDHACRNPARPTVAPARIG